MQATASALTKTADVSSGVRAKNPPWEVNGAPQRRRSPMEGGSIHVVVGKTW